MKKLIPILVAPLLLGSCKKQAVDPVSTATDKPTTIGLYHQPTKVEVTQIGGVFNSTINYTYTYTYDSEGLVASISTYIDTAGHSLDNLLQTDQYQYLNGKLSKINSLLFPTSLLHFHANSLETGASEFSYEDEKMKTYRIRDDSSDTRYTYYYDAKDRVDYILSIVKGIVGDSISVRYDSANANYEGYTYLSYYGKGQGDPLDSVLHGYKNYSVYNSSYILKKMTPGFAVSSGMQGFDYLYSKVPNHFQNQVYFSFFSINTAGYPTRYLMDQLWKNFHVASMSTTRYTNEYEYIVDNMGRVTKISEWYVPEDGGARVLSREFLFYY
jgi:hypothetical protein